MGSIVAIEHVTLDGVMQGPARADEDRRDGFQHGGWAEQRSDRSLQDVMGERMGADWSLLVGRVTYEGLLYWPRQEPDHPFTQAFAGVRKFVSSNSLSEPLEWQNSTLLSGDPVNTVADLKHRYVGNLVIFGSGVLVRSLMSGGLVDEFVLMVHPVVLGTGRRLFGSLEPPNHLELESSASTNNGVIAAVYRRSA